MSVAALGFAILSFWLTFQVATERAWILRIDTAGLDLTVERGTLPRDIAELLILLGQRGLVLTVLLVAAFWLYRATGSWHPVLLVAMGSLTLNVVVAALKVVLARSRPISQEPRFLNPDTIGEIGLFPSGHASNAAFSWLVLLYLLSRKQNWSHTKSVIGALVASTATALMSLGSLMLGHHWITDLLVGAFIGWAIACAFIAVDITVSWASQEKWQRLTS